MIFKIKGFDVFEAANGKIALEQISKIQPDIIILDILMPVMGGIAFLEEADIKQMYPKSKVLVLSNLSDTKSISRIKELGADKHLLKSSVTPDELVSAVTQLIR
jgi:DNA-binding NarL/FixJ family response regulator